MQKPRKPRKPKLPSKPIRTKEKTNLYFNQKDKTLSFDCDKEGLVFYYLNVDTIDKNFMERFNQLCENSERPVLDWGFEVEIEDDYGSQSIGTTLNVLFGFSKEEEEQNKKDHIAAMLKYKRAMRDYNKAMKEFEVEIAKYANFEKAEEIKKLKQKLSELEG